MERNYQYSFGELIDRLSILSLKYLENKELRPQYQKEISGIIDDLNMIMTNKPGGFKATAEFMWAIVILAQFNLKIWSNEDNARSGDPENNELFKTHIWNGVRCRAKDRISKAIGDRVDPKVNALSAIQLEDEPFWA